MAFLARIQLGRIDGSRSMPIIEGLKILPANSSDEGCLMRIALLTLGLTGGDASAFVQHIVFYQARTAEVVADI